jgi:hypothetical protein
VQLPPPALARLRCADQIGAEREHGDGRPDRPSTVMRPDCRSWTHGNGQPGSIAQLAVDGASIKQIRVVRNLEKLCS